MLLYLLFTIKKLAVILQGDRYIPECISMDFATVSYIFDEPYRLQIETG